MPGPYDGVHAFLYLHDNENNDSTPPSEVIEALQPYVDPDEGPVFFASLLDGDFAGFVHFAADDLQSLVHFTGTTLFDAGVRSDYETEGSVHTGTDAAPRGPKRRSPRFCAICRVRTSKRPAGVLDAIADEFGNEDPFVGGSRVIGRFPVLVELGADDSANLENAIERLRNVDGVLAVKVGTTDTRGTA